MNLTSHFLECNHTIYKLEDTQVLHLKTKGNKKNVFEALQVCNHTSLNIEIIIQIFGVFILVTFFLLADVLMMSIFLLVHLDL